MTLSRTARLLLAIVSGVALALAFPIFNLPLLAWISPAGLILDVLNETPQYALLLGWLQGAAVIGEGDAIAFAQALQQKKFPAFVITPGTDKYYRVQVGPYADTQFATNARHDLEANGFKSIVKR